MSRRFIALCVVFLSGIAGALQAQTYHFNFTVAPDNGGSWAPGARSTVVTVTNDGTTTIPAGTLLYVENRMLTWQAGRTITPQSGVFLGNKVTPSGNCVLFTNIPNPGQYYASVGCNATLNSAFAPGESFDAKFTFTLNAGPTLQVGGSNNQLNDCGTGWIKTPGFNFQGGGLVGCNFTPAPCNLIRNGDFETGLNVVGDGSLSSTASSVANWTAAFSTPQITSLAGCGGSPGYFSMWGNQVVGEGIRQTLSAPLVPGRTYRLSACVRWRNVANLPQHVRFRVRLSNGVLATYTSPGTLLGIIGNPSNTPSIPAPGITSTQWTWVTLANWTAPTASNLDTITITPENNSNVNNGSFVSWGEIDNICLQDVTNLCPALQPDFSLKAELVAGNATTFSVTATNPPLPPGVRFFWEVEEVDANGNPVAGTKVTNPSAWWPNPTQNVFAGYDGTSTLNTSLTTGQFKQGRRYRIRRGLWNLCNPWAEATHSVFMSTP